ncbi:hypothetical protein AA103196_3089 [Ameyamaea chiangmaiensis NBRC 103196]|uniref:Uncharacterized protein n=1 Tax=Ameyamaea chiangmaiensis TaxID=442969 RepID=A0A850P9V7_9PROT|nr:hypothetical protein [Ameyamaea chiangmaiensis]MBS4074574.1 hypothetical protein [Ameyamaea chiangmaiensis]NVN39330.1 hypothetical protein [Ameyamaea chiangmaiensis]GBQ72536.1 hypothetical protein AA103196_3089 [Ameyamaea chiangmaiensis NBRC 103196]
MTLPQLGALPAQVRPGQPRLAPSLRMMARQAPPRLLRDHIDPAPLMLGNDTLGDCTSAGLGNHIRATAALGGFQVGVRTADAIQFYERSTGYTPADPSTDQGGIESDVLTYASRNGYALENETLFPIWGTAEPDDFNGMRNIMASMGAAYLGVQLAIADQGDGVLDTTTPGDQTPGSWGGHCLLAWGYTGTADTDLVSLLTWGTIRQATWRWVRSRIMECHGVAWRQLVPASGMTLMGGDWGALVEANREYLAG